LIKYSQVSLSHASSNNSGDSITHQVELNKNNHNNGNNNTNSTNQNADTGYSSSSGNSTESSSYNAKPSQIVNVTDYLSTDPEVVSSICNTAASDISLSTVESSLTLKQLECFNQGRRL